ncbi:hypothetical protein [Streptomyces sp. NBC_00344]|uniref:hypothetical protein n=1 Tax=Streptomyces sp. NBC_00344 TaxID=2975720 RepID=UPI002E1A099B
MSDEAQEEIDGLRARVAALEGRPAPRHRVRSFFAALLIVIAALLTPVAAVAVWAHDEIGDTGRYVDAVAPLASDPAVQHAVTDRVTDAVMRYVSVDALVESVAPDDRAGLREALGPLNGPINSGLRNLVQRAVGSLVSSPAFSTVWIQLNRTAHASVVHALTSGKGNKVTVDLAPVVKSAKERLDDTGLSIASRIPEVHTRFTVLESDAVGRARTAFRLLGLAGVWLPVVTVLLAVSGVLIAVRRRRALITAALAVAAGALLLGAGIAVFRSLYLDRLPEIVPQPAAVAVFDALVGFLRTTVRMVVALGAVVALSAWLSGPGRWPVRARAMWTGGIGAVRNAAGMRTGPVGRWFSRARTALNWAVVACALAVYLVWDRPTAAVVVGIALCAPAVMAVIELLADDGADPRTGAAPARDRPDGTAAG